MWSALFPGQGSQHPGMGEFLFANFPLVKNLFEEGSDTLSLKLKSLCFSGNEAELALTENTQPCLLLVSTATQMVLKEEFGFQPALAAGHSVGEYSALVAAGVLPFAAALKAVRQRGQAMQAAVPVGQGGMTAVLGLEPRQVEELCQWAEKTTGLSPVQPANFNAPGQVVISGLKKLLDWIPEHYTNEVISGPGRAKFIALKVSAPFHCRLMQPAEDLMADVLGQLIFKDAKFPIVQNVNAQATTKAFDLKANLICQVSAPVRWTECVQQIQKMGSENAVEVGCGKVLAGLGKKIAGDRLRIFNLNSLDDLRALGVQLKGTQE